MEKDNKSIASRFLQGWGQLFGGSKKAPQPKPFPADRFFYREELEFLSNKKEPLMPIEKWAVEAGRKAFAKEYGSNARPGFNHVQWQNGIMSSYINTRPVQDGEEEQVSKLKELKALGYVLPEDQLDKIRKFEAKDIVGKYFKTNNGDIFDVTDFKAGENEKASLSLIKYTQNDLVGKRETVDFEDFKESVNTYYHPLSSREESIFNTRLEAARYAEIIFDRIGRTAFRSPVEITNGKIPLEQQKAYSDENGLFIPTEWEINYGGTTITVKGHSTQNEEKTLVLNYMNARNHRDLLNTIEEGVDKQYNMKLSASLAEILGNKLPNGDILYLPTRGTVLFNTDNGDAVDSLMVHKDGELFAFSKFKRVELSRKDLFNMKNCLMIDGTIEQEKLEKALAVPLMKDYVESLTIADDIHSGDIDKLPVNTRIKSLCRQEWDLEQAYNQYANHPADEDFANQYKAEWNAASVNYSLELKRLVEAYKNDPGVVDVEKKARFDRLNELLQFQKATAVLQQDQSPSIQDAVKKEKRPVEETKAVAEKTEEQKPSAPIESVAAAPKESVKPEKEREEQQVIQTTAPTGRWHTADIKQKEAYLQYGKLLSDRLALQQTYHRLPLTNNERSVPTDLNCEEYKGLDALMLSLDCEKNGYSLPVYLTKKELEEKKLLLKKNAVGFSLVRNGDVITVYNVENTNYSFRNPEEYDKLKKHHHSENHSLKMDNDLSYLLQPKALTVNFAIDGKPGLASYDAQRDTIHLATMDQYTHKDDYYRDMSIGMLRSVRNKEARNTKYNALIREELITLVGAAIVGQKNKFNVITPQQSILWREKLRNDPSYNQEVFSSASITSQLLLQRIDVVKKGNFQELDLRSTTPVDMDLDGNGIVDSQENYAPDKKQGSSEVEEKKEDAPRHEARGHLRR